MRKLASIQKVLNVRPIEGADLIEAVDVLGWTVVTQKSNNLKVGDLVIYFEVDSFLNATDPRYASFEERFVNWDGKRGMRLKTIKLRKQISQGLILPLADFPEAYYGDREVWEGKDLTEILKLEKWEPAEDNSTGNTGLAGKKVGAFPSFIRKTDQERVQNYINELPKHKDETFEVTVKLDGSSMTIFHVGKSSPHYAHILADQRAKEVKRAKGLRKWWLKFKNKFGFLLPKDTWDIPDCFTGVCSRNIQLDENDVSHFSSYTRGLGLLGRLKEYGMNVAVQGELIGPSIQDNYEKVDELEFYVFDIFDIDTQEYVKPRAARAIAAELGLKYVPVHAEAIFLTQFDPEPRAMVENILAYAEGQGLNKGVKREGLVFKSNQSDFSFKAISNSYLLKKEGKKPTNQGEMTQ